MTRPIRAAAAALLLLAACAPRRPVIAEARRAWAEKVNKGLTDWSNVSSTAMVEKYGPPDRVETLRLVWEKRGPWKRIQVWDELELLDDDRASSNIEDTISYPVPGKSRGALASFHRGLRVSPDGAELSARSSDEARNFLLLNLADDIVKGSLTPKEARDAYARTLRLADSGKTSPSMERLLFRPAGVNEPSQ
jgi:hypothetical protein